MPKESLNVYFSIVDGGSATLTKLTDKTKALDKESQQLEQTYQALQKANSTLIKKKAELQSQLNEVNKEVKDARKAFNALADEANSDAYEKALEKQAALRSEIAGTTKALQENQKMYKENIETVRKNSQSGGMFDGVKGIAFGLASSGVGSQLSSALGGWIQAGYASEKGMPEASMISDTISGLISGAAAGAALGLPGILAGAAAGAFSGIVSAKTKIYEAKDDAFKDYYKTLYEDAASRQEQSLSSGSTLAASREQDAISFATLFKDRDKADSYLSGMVDMANTTPFLYDDLKGMSKTLATYGWDDQGILPVLQKIGDAGAALGMATSDMSAVATALGRMQSSDKASLEYLNILNDRGIGAVGYLAEAKGVSVGDMYGMISKNEISGTEAVEILLSALERDFSGSMLEQSRTFSGLSSTLEGLKAEIDNAGGEGYNAEKNKGIQADIDAYGGALGEALQYVNTIAGETQARMENLEARYQREALEAVLLGNRPSGLFSQEDQEQLAAWRQSYREAVETLERTGGKGMEGLEAGKRVEDLKTQAETLAQAAFDSSAESKTLQDVELDHIAAIRDSIVATDNLAGALNSYNTNQEFSKGQGAGGFFGGNTLADSGQSALAGSYTGTGRAAMPGGGGSFRIPDYVSRASGQRVVPYDNFPILAHQGERLLTAEEAREQDENAASGGGVQIVVTGNTFQGTGEDMADQIAGMLLEKLQLARMKG